MCEEKYEKAIITYLDILGFKSRIAKISKESDENKKNKLIEEIDDLLNVMESITKRDSRGNTSKIDLKVTSFSDLVVRSYYYENEGEFHEILHTELSELKRIQRDLVMEGIFIRGAVTIGQIFHRQENKKDKKRVVFGEGLIRAYKMESEKTIYPIIMIDQNIIDKYKQNTNEPRHKFYLAFNETSPHDILIRTKTQKCFINYLSPYLEKFNVRDSTFINTHKNQILNQITENREDLGILNKYFWLANYHNHIVDKYFNKEEEIVISCSELFDRDYFQKALWDK